MWPVEMAGRFAVAWAVPARAHCLLHAHPRNLGPVGGGPEPGAPLSGVELRRFGLLEESLERCDEASRRFELRQVADPVEDLQAAAGDGLVGVLAMADGDDRIPRTPHDEDGYALGEVQPVAGVDALTAHADDRAQRGEEGGPAARVGERRVAASDLGDVRSGPDGPQPGDRQLPRRLHQPPAGHRAARQRGVDHQRHRGRPVRPGGRRVAGAAADQRQRRHAGFRVRSLPFQGRQVVHLPTVAEGEQDGTAGVPDRARPGPGHHRHRAAHHDQLRGDRVRGGRPQGQDHLGAGGTADQHRPSRSTRRPDQSRERDEPLGQVEQDLTAPSARHRRSPPRARLTAGWDRSTTARSAH